MLILVSGATAALRTTADARFGVLVVPDANNNPAALPLRPRGWAMDNGAYSGLNKVAFINMLHRYHGCAGCLFVTAPDVVGDAAATLALWPFWSQLLRGLDYAPAFVLQDGQEPGALPRNAGAVFVGGTTGWKLNPAARGCVALAKARGLWCHMGRVNSRVRLREAYRWGIDSIDGSSRSMFGEKQLTKDQRFMDEWHAQPALSL